jgi:amino acid permease
MLVSPAWLFVSYVSAVVCFGFESLTPSPQFSGWDVFLKGKWETDTFVTNYLPLVLFPIVYAGAKFYYRVPIVSPQDMDFVSDIAEIEADEYVHTHSGIFKSN